MFKFFNQLIDYIQRLFEFLVNIIKALITAVGVLTSAVQFPLGLVGYLPAILGSCIVVVVAVGAVKFIIGR